MTTATKLATTPLQLVQNLYEAFGRGDIDYILARIAPDCSWVVAGPGIPVSGTYTGPSGVAEFFRKMTATEQIVRFEAREFFANGDDVVALGMEECRVVDTGKTASTNWAMLFRTHNGNVVHYECFYDTAAYALAHQK